MQQILDGILEAIEDEIKAQRHYRMLADKSEDLMMKNFFEQLILDEENHEKVLRTRYEAFAKLLNRKKDNNSDQQ